MFCSRFCFVSSLCSLAVANMQYSLCGRLPSLRSGSSSGFALLVDSDNWLHFFCFTEQSCFAGARLAAFAASGFIALRRDKRNFLQYTLSRRSFSEDGSTRFSLAKPALLCNIAPDPGRWSYFVAHTPFRLFVGLHAVIDYGRYMPKEKVRS